MKEAMIRIARPVAAAKQAAAGKQEAALKQVTAAKPLVLRIQTSRREYLVGEPVTVTVTVENTGGSDVLFRKFMRTPGDEGRNNLEFRVTDSDGRRLERVSRPLAGRAIVWPTFARLGRSQKYGQIVQLAGTYRTRAGGDVSTGPMWSLGEHAGTFLANDYPAQKPGRYFVTAVYRNRDNGRRWPEGLGLEDGRIWTGELWSETLEIEIVAQAEK